MSKSGSSLLRGARAQAAVEAVGPGVVGALDRAALLRLVHEDGAAVAAHVQEGAQLALAVEHHDQRQAADLRGEHAAGAVELAGVTHVLPGAPEDGVLLGARHLGSAYQLYGSVSTRDWTCERPIGGLSSQSRYRHHPLLA